MRTFHGLLLGAIMLMTAVAAEAAPARILKVLPHLLDEKGRHTLAPSLFERDAYQARLRDNSELVSALRFDVQWKRGDAKGKTLRMRIEARGNKAGSKMLTVEREVRFKGVFTAWSELKVSKEQYLALGGVNAWRATLWDGDQQLHEVKSFLW